MTELDTYQAFAQRYPEMSSLSGIDGGELYRWNCVFQDYCRGVPLLESCQNRQVAPADIPTHFLEIFQDIVVHTAPQTEWDYWLDALRTSENHYFACEVMSAYMGIPSSRIKQMPARMFERLVEEWCLV